jgi:transposase
MPHTHTYTAQLSSVVHARLNPFLEQQRCLYNAVGAGGWVRKVDPKQMSQDGSRCGYRVRKTLSDRRHACPECGLCIDRDWNVALNIVNRGLKDSPPSGGNIPSGTAGAENGGDCSLSL